MMTERFRVAVLVLSMSSVVLAQGPPPVADTQVQKSTTEKAAQDKGKSASPQKPPAPDDDKQKAATPKQTESEKGDAAVAAAQKSENADFSLVLGIGSLIINDKVTDYTNQSNVLHATNLGTATPQFLTGLSFRTHIPGFLKDCKSPSCADWLRHPWSAFVSLKFSPGSSQVVDGYVIGGSFSIARYLQVLVGYALSPVNEPAPGFQTTASQFVTQEHSNGRALAFDPVSMKNNGRYAFDGFPVTDSNGKLIYSGDPLTVHHRGGVVIGVSFPISFKAALE